jgi:hypothetical protein
MTAGDASFHSGWVLHSAPSNATDVLREVMTVIYFADGARVTEPDNRNRARDLQRWLPGLKPGDLAASAINPRLASAHASRCLCWDHCASSDLHPAPDTLWTRLRPSAMICVSRLVRRASRSRR